MAYIAKSSVLNAYKHLSDIDKDKQQGLTQKVSALKYLSALDLYYKNNGENCDLKDSANKDTFASYVGDIVRINDDFCTKDFYMNISGNGRDFDCGSNFYSQSSVKDSKTNPYNTFLYPKRSGWKPVMDIKNQVLFHRPDYYSESFSFYLNSSQLRLSFIIWLLRFENITEKNIDGIKTALFNLFTREYCEALFTEEILLTDTSIIEFDSEICQLENNDILDMFSIAPEEKEINTLKRDVSFPLQQIFYGAPGTGKSHGIKYNEKVRISDEKNLVFRTTFHPDSDYSTFVGAYKPTLKPVADKYKAVAGKDEEITYEFIPQAFLQAYIAAWNNREEDVFLVIEEINRGNCAQIFGDLFQLLDRDGNGFSEYPIMADRDLAKFLTSNDVLVNKDGIKDGKLLLPANLYIWATMNTSDQSLFPIDSAFKRRWEWKYLPINNHQDLNYKIEVGDTKYDWWGFLSKINEVIGNTTSSEDKKLGYFFAKANANGVVTAEQFVGKVLFYLWNDVFKNYGFDNQIFDKGDKKKFDFSDFFMQDGSPETEMVSKFLARLDETIDKENTFVETKDNKGQEEQSDTQA